MAGIGLRLHRVVAKGTYLESLTAYLSSAIISSGPWLSAVIALGLLGGLVVTFLNQGDRTLLFATITYCFSLSLLLTGGMQMVVTRYLADRLYLNDARSFAPTCTGLLLAAAPLSVLTLPFVLLAPFDLRYKLITATLFITLTLTWLVVVFLSAAKDYMRLFLVFVFSYGVSLVGAVVLGQSLGALGGLCGFTLGQMLCLGLLVARIYREFTPVEGINLGFLPYLLKYWDLFVIGMLYVIGLWADNLILWFAPGSLVVNHFYHLFPAYDSAKLIAYLATIPASTIFLIHLETNFYRHYHDFFKHIRDKGTLGQIMEAKAGMVEAAQSGLMTVLTVQGVMCAALFFFAPRLAHIMGQPDTWVPLLRNTVLAAGCQFIMLTLFILLLYLDERPVTLLVVLIFAGGNIGLTLLTRQTGYSTYGLGFLVAAFAAALVALFFLFNRLRRIEFLTFMSQPLL